MGGFLSKTELEALAPGSIQTTDIADGAVSNAKLATPASRTIIAVPITLANLAVGGGDVVTDILPGFAGTLESIFFIVGTPGVGTGATIALHPEIGADAVTGGVVTLTEAGTATLGVYIAGTDITALNTFTDADVLSLVSAAGTVFTGGNGVMVLVCSVAGQ